jgi:hypothetical protein
LVKQFEGHLDKPKKFWISTDEKLNDFYFMKVQSNIIESQDMAMTYLEFKDSSMDTIKTQYEITSHSTYLTKVWYNSKLKCDIYDDSDVESLEGKVGCYFTINHNME